MWPSEKKFADLLDKQGRKWEYPAKTFTLPTSAYTSYKNKRQQPSYRPDFYLPDEDLYIEVVGTPAAYSWNKSKIALFRKLYPKIRFIIVDYFNNPYPYKNKKGLILKEENQRQKEWFKLFKSVKISSVLYDEIVKLANDEGREIKYFINKAIENFLKAKKVTIKKDWRI